MELIVNNLKKNYDKKEVIKGASFTFKKGVIYGLIGKNGSGKTTFFNCISNETDDYVGEILLKNEESINKIDTSDVGYVISTPSVPEFLTGREFLKFFLEVNEKRIKNPKTIDEYFDFLSIDEEDRDKLLKEYSHGMKNKIQMIVNIIINPNILLLDEPLTSFDVLAADDMKNILKNQKKEHITIFSTHILELALDLCDEIVILNNGILTLIDHKDIEVKEFKEKIISSLKENNND